MTRSTIRLIRFGSAKTLTQANFRFGLQEPEELSDKYIV